MTEFVVNNKTYLVTKVFPFIANYSKKLRIRTNIKRILGQLMKVYRDSQSLLQENAKSIGYMYILLELTFRRVLKE